MMKIKANLLATRALKRFTELRDLDPHFLEGVQDKADLLLGNKGEKLAECLFNDPVAFFLLQGDVDCQSGMLGKQRIAGNAPQSAKMLNNFLPKGGAFIAAGDNTVLMAVRKRDINQSRIFNNKPLAAADKAYAIADIADSTADNNDDDWMSRMLLSPLFHHLDPSRIQKLFASFREKYYQPGDTVIRQGEHDEHFYVIKSGKARVLLEHPVDQQEIVLSEGCFFGEGAIVGGTVHSASIQMVTTGVVGCINAAQFDDLIKDTLLRYIRRDELGSLVPTTAQTLLLDVRLPVEFRHGHSPDSLNIPIHTLRNRLREMPFRGKTCLVEHGDDKRSQLAALILAGQGYTVFLLTD